MTSRLPSLRVDPYLLLLGGTVLLAAIAPARGIGAKALEIAVELAVAGLFFVYGAKLSTTQVLSALVDYKPQALIFTTTFVVFPVIGLGLTHVLEPWLDDGLRTGLLFLSILPSTVQSSIAFTSIAGGNVATALCSASVSNLAGVILTPLFTSWLIASGVNADPLSAVFGIGLQILLPFLLGQLGRRWLFAWLDRHRLATLMFDRGSILLVVYSAFSAGMLAGVWSRLSWWTLISIFTIDALLLASVLLFSFGASRFFRFKKDEEIAIVFCSSKKSMASGIPMANVLFSAQTVSVTVLPLMIFHQLQLFVCAVIAERYARTRTDRTGLGEPDRRP